MNMNMNMTTVTVADALLMFFESVNITDMFFLPGGGAMHLNDALARSTINGVHGHHEQGAVIAAEAWGRMRGIAGVAMVTTGPGATNALTPVAGAWIESVPLVILSGQVKTADINDGTLRQKGVQEVSVVEMAKPVCKWAKTLLDPKTALIETMEAWRIAHEGRQGPVWIDVPLDIQGYKLDVEQVRAVIDDWHRNQEKPQNQRKESLNESVLWDALEKRLGACQKPLLLLGHGVRLSGSQDQWIEWAKSNQVPCVFTWNAMDMLDFNDPLNAGRPGVVAHRHANMIVQKADLLVVVGARMDNIVTAFNPKNFGKNAFKVMIDVDANEMKKLKDGTIQLGIECEASSAIEKIKGMEVKKNMASWLNEIEHIKNVFKKEREVGAQNDDEVISSMDASKLIGMALDENTLIATGSSGLAIEAFYANFENKKGQRIFLTSGLGAMGYGVSAGLGAWIGNGKKRSVLVESDGSLMMNIQELASLKTANASMVIVLLDNNGYASIRATQRNYFDSRYLGTGPSESGVFFPSWEKICEAFEIEYINVKKAQDVPVCIHKAIKAESGITLVHLHLKENEALWPKCAAIPLANGGMMSMPLEDLSPLVDLDVLKSVMGEQIDEASIKARKI